MKKCTFYRTIYNPGERGTKAVKTEGFCETLTDKNGNEITLCFHKTPTIPCAFTLTGSFVVGFSILRFISLIPLNP